MEVLGPNDRSSLASNALSSLVELDSLPFAATPQITYVEGTFVRSSSDGLEMQTGLSCSSMRQTWLASHIPAQTLFMEAMPVDRWTRGLDKRQSTAFESPRYSHGHVLCRDKSQSVYQPAHFLAALDGAATNLKRTTKRR